MKTFLCHVPRTPRRTRPRPRIGVRDRAATVWNNTAPGHVSIPWWYEDYTGRGATRYMPARASPTTPGSVGHSASGTSHAVASIYKGLLGEPELKNKRRRRPGRQSSNT